MPFCHKYAPILLKHNENEKNGEQSSRGLLSVCIYGCI